MNDLTSDQIDSLHEAFAKEGYTPSEAHAAIEEHRKSLREEKNKEDSLATKSFDSITKAINDVPWFTPPAAVAGTGAAIYGVSKAPSILSRMFGKAEETPRIEPQMNVNQQPVRGRIEPTFDQANTGMEVATPEEMKRFESHPVFQENPSLVTEEQFNLQQKGLQNRAAKEGIPTDLTQKGIDASLERVKLLTNMDHSEEMMKQYYALKQKHISEGLMNDKAFGLQEEKNIANAAKPTSNMPLNPVNPTDQIIDVNNPKPEIQAQSAQNQALGEQMASDPNVQHEALVEEVKQGVPPNTPVNPSASTEELQNIESLGQVSQDLKEKGSQPPPAKQQPVKATRLRGEPKAQVDEMKRMNKGYNQYSQKLGGLGDIPNKASSILQPQFDSAWEDLHQNVFKGVNPKSQSGNPEFWNDAVKYLQSQPEKYKDILDFMERNKEYATKGAALEKGFSNFGLMAGTAGAGLAGLGLYQAFKHGMNTGDWSNLGMGVADTAAAFKLSNPAMIPWALASHIGGLNTNENQELQYRRQIGNGRGVAPPSMGQR